MLYFIFAVIYLFSSIEVLHLVIIRILHRQLRVRRVIVRICHSAHSRLCAGWVHGADGSGADTFCFLGDHALSSVTGAITWSIWFPPVNHQS